MSKARLCATSNKPKFTTEPVVLGVKGLAYRIRFPGLVLGVLRIHQVRLLA